MVHVSAGIGVIARLTLVLLATGVLVTMLASPNDAGDRDANPRVQTARIAVLQSEGRSVAHPFLMPMLR